ncbi:uncharacterized protein PHACADRAFT_197657 [Phanerochaete carnosa HHB-10118-sp]|uniref:3'-5' exonuclease domain-containing protein n=1 Tax=Phanerochaete carnosa (strain HHB-10118-sp) TaxID=650164 RepID=K5W294_PHACS|nr:uncharacterized protein PHACADRAFT_197657 [Phanerochaete carnosa HHB-10118-sp]EKM53235.1 hypothetical protein PHACADRAFT_197657 [Phanerochaete carnosa HHB-10118-sp]
MPAPHPQTIPSTPVPLKYVYCDSPATYASAVWVLRTAPYLILDCEGYNLGRAGGCVTLICVGTPFAEHIFLFDLLSPLITGRDIYYLLHLLCDPTLLKVVWDGRMDFLEIITSFGVALEGVLDLQVAEVASRQIVRGEGDKDRLERLGRSYISQQLAKRSEQLQDLHAVIGLQRCWVDCGYAREVGKDRESALSMLYILSIHKYRTAQVISMHKNRGCDMWLRRPLTEQLLQYAAKDILLIGVLYPHFDRNGWIPKDDAGYNCLMRQCRRYISAHREQGKSSETDVFGPCSIMPLDTVTEPFGPLHRCHACNRSLSVAAFSNCPGVAPSSPGSGSAPRYAILRRPRCRLCSILAAKNSLKVDERWLVT